MKKRPGSSRRTPTRSGGRPSSNRPEGPAPAERERGELEMSRRSLTLLEHEGTIWSVYISSHRHGPPEERYLLEFERAGPDGAPVRYTHPLTGPLLDAVQAGESVSRESLREELARALAGGEVAGLMEAEGRKRVWRPLNDPDEEVPETTRS
jgi:hypothetical protein